MPARQVSVTTATPYTQLCAHDKARVLLHFFNPKSNAGEIYIYDGNTETNHVFQVEPGDLICLLAAEGYNVTRAWYAASTASAGTQTLLVYEEVLPYEAMEIIKAKTGLDSTVALALLGVLTTR